MIAIESNYKNITAFENINNNWQPLFRELLNSKQAEWQEKLNEGYLSPATGVMMSLTTSVLDGESIFDKALLLAVDVPGRINAGVPLSSEYTIRAKDGSKVPNATLGMAAGYLNEISKIKAKVEQIKGELFDAQTIEDLNAIDLEFSWDSILS